MHPTVRTAAALLARHTRSSVSVLALAALAPAAALACAPTAAPAATAVPASDALVNHLVQVLERREQAAAGGLFGNAAPATTGLADAFQAQRQLAALGARAGAAAPRLAALLQRSERHGYDLAFALWSTSPRGGADTLPALAEALTAATGADRLVLLAQLGQTRCAQALPLLRAAVTSAEAGERLMAAVAIGFQADPATGDEPALLLASMLQDGHKPVRSAAANGLRLLGRRSQPAVPALIDYLRTRDNVFMAMRALASAPTQQLLEAQPELEAVLADGRLTSFQKQPAVELLMRIEQARARSATPAPATSQPSPAAPAVRPAPQGLTEI